MASLADAFPTPPGRGTTLRHRRIIHQHKSVFPSPQKKQVGAFHDDDGDQGNSNPAQDFVGDPGDSTAPGQPRSQISTLTWEPAVSPQSERRPPIPIPRLPLRDLTNIDFDEKATCYTGTTLEIPDRKFITKFAVPLVPLRNSAQTRVETEGEGDSTYTGNYATADSKTNEVYGKVDHILDEQKRQDLDRLRAQLAALPSKPRHRWLDLKKLAAYKKKNGYSEGFDRPPDPKSAPAQVETFGSGCIDHPANSRYTGGRLKVRCGSATLNLPIAGDTTSNDIRSAASSIIPHDAGLETSVVVECIVAQGLERVLRGYEDICELMNSWGSCHENFLRIDQSTASIFGQGVAGVAHAESPVTNSSFLLYHAPNLKEWNERWVTLRADGQLIAIDSENYSPDNTEELCHLSMFDIYTVSERGSKHYRNAPGPYCYALKSQKKAGLSQETIHFFCTADAALADRFRRLVHCWRSRYLLQRKNNIRGCQLTAEDYGALGQTLGFSASATRSEAPSVGPGNLSPSAEESTPTTPPTKESRNNTPPTPASFVSVRKSPKTPQSAVCGPVFGCQLEPDKDHVSPITPWPETCYSSADYFGSHSGPLTADGTSRATGHEFL